MMTVSLITTDVVPTTIRTHADFAVSFGHALAVLPLHKRFQAQEICKMICPDFTNQKCVAYLRKAVAYGIMKREEVEKIWIDKYGCAHKRITAYYYRI